ncbi:MAG TPA: hypothetical protein DCY88_06725, partial [Cyanobacteria bacterium UBA11372]|nr:hypothetical protein [Cyanobacteria bacterium UBA11372]
EKQGEKYPNISRNRRAEVASTVSEFGSKGKLFAAGGVRRRGMTHGGSRVCTEAILGANLGKIPSPITHYPLPITHYQNFDVLPGQLVGGI